MVNIISTFLLLNKFEDTIELVFKRPFQLTILIYENLKKNVNIAKYTVYKIDYSRQNVHIMYMNRRLLANNRLQ